MLLVLALCALACLPRAQDPASYPNGRPRELGRVVAGRREGPWTELHPCGHKSAEGSYANGKKRGPWSRFDEFGRSIGWDSPEAGKSTSVAPAFPVRRDDLWLVSAGAWTVGECVESLAGLRAVPAPDAARAALREGGPLAAHAMVEALRLAHEPARRAVLSGVACCRRWDDVALASLSGLRAELGMYDEIEAVIAALPLERAASLALGLQRAFDQVNPELRELLALDPVRPRGPGLGPSALSIVPQLRALLLHPSGWDRARIARVLRAVRAEPRQRGSHWTALLEAGTRLERIEAAAMLPHFAPLPDRAVGALRASLGADDPVLTHLALEALAGAGVDPSFAELRPLLDAADAPLRASAFGIASRGPHSHDLLAFATGWWASGDRELRGRVVSLATEHPAELAGLLPPLLERCDERGLGNAILRQLARIAPDDRRLLEAALARLGSPETGMDARALLWQWNATASRDAPEIAALRRDPDPVLRETACVSSLVRERDAEVRAARVADLLADPAPRLRWAALPFVAGLAGRAARFEGRLRKLVEDDLECGADALLTLARTTEDLEEFRRLLGSHETKPHLRAAIAECRYRLLGGESPDAERTRAWLRSGNPAELLAARRAAGMLGIGEEPADVLAAKVTAYVAARRTKGGCPPGPPPGRTLPAPPATTLGEAAIPAFAELLGSEDPESRRWGAHALAEFAQRALRTLPALQKAIDAETQGFVLVDLVDAIPAVAGPQGTGILTELLGHRSVAVRRCVHATLAKHGHGYGHVAELLFQQAEDGELYAERALLALGAEAQGLVPSLRGILRDALRDETQSAEVGRRTWRAEQVLGSIGPPARAALSELMALEARGDSGAFAAAASIAPEDPEVRARVRVACTRNPKGWATMRAIASLGERGLEFAPCVVACARAPDEGNVDEPVRALHTLSAYRPSLLQDLVEIASGPHGRTSEAARFALLERVDSAKAALGSRSAWIRRCAVSALARLRTPDAVTCLEAVVRGRDPEVFEAALEGLAEIDALHPLVVAAVRDWIAPWNHDVIPPLLGSGRPPLECPPGKVRTLVGLLARELEAMAVEPPPRNKAFWPGDRRRSGLAEIVVPRTSLPELVAMLDEPNAFVQRAALALLSRMTDGADGACDALTRLCARADAETFRLACDFLQQVRPRESHWPRLRGLRPDLFPANAVTPASDPERAELEIDGVIRALRAPGCVDARSLRLLAAHGSSAASATRDVLRAAGWTSDPAAIRTLGEIAPAAGEATPWLEWQLGHGMPASRAAAADALHRIAARAAAPR